MELDWRRRVDRARAFARRTSQTAQAILALETNNANEANGAAPPPSEASVLYNSLRRLRDSVAMLSEIGNGSGSGALDARYGAQASELVQDAMDAVSDVRAIALRNHPIAGASRPAEQPSSSNPPDLERYWLTSVDYVFISQGYVLLATPTVDHRLKMSQWKKKKIDLGRHLGIIA
jgi:hypothetical protein